jgi:hypothetical protein
LEHAQKEHWLKEVFHSHPQLAYSWLERQLTNLGLLYFRQEKGIKTAIDVLDSKARTRVLDLVSVDQFRSADFVAYLAGDDLAVFEVLLATERLKKLHLAPLLGYPEGVWAEKALLALEAGYSSDQIADAAFKKLFTWSGNESDMWATWVEKFEVLCKHEDERIQEIGRIGRDRAQASKEAALRREKLEAIYRRW